MIAGRPRLVIFAGSGALEGVPLALFTTGHGELTPAHGPSS